MDEPFEGLAPVIIDRVQTVIREVAAEGAGVLLVEQQVAAALRVADHVYVMGKGHIVFDGTPADFAERPEIRSAYLGVS